MKRISALLALFVIVLTACNSKSKQATVAEVTEAGKTCCEASKETPCCGNSTAVAEYPQLVYFHNERRCATCMAVEDVAKEVIDSFTQEKIAFHSYQIGDEACQKLVDDLQISGQTLLLMGKDTTINLTQEAFMYARVNPDKYKEVLNAALGSII